MRTLYDQYSGHVMAIAMRYVPNRDDALDIVQDTFVKVLTSFGGFEYRGTGSLKAWISRIASNMALDFLRRRNMISISDTIPDMADTPSPDIGGISDKVLFELIGQLPTGYRVVLNMFVFEQMSHTEIAAKLGIKECTSASQYFHAKKLLGKMIEQYNKRQ